METLTEVFLFTNWKYFHYRMEYFKAFDYYIHKIWNSCTYKLVKPAEHRGTVKDKFWACKFHILHVSSRYMFLLFFVIKKFVF